MAEYIERKAVLDYIDHMPSELTSDGRRMIRRIRLTEYISDSIPAADVTPVRHGRWVLTTQPLGWRDEDCAECSECGEDFVLDEWGIDDVKDAMRYCPNCGARMEES